MVSITEIERMVRERLTEQVNKIAQGEAEAAKARVQKRTMEAAASMAVELARHVHGHIAGQDIIISVSDAARAAR